MAFLVAFLLGAPAWAEDEKLPARLRQASECPMLFGEAKDHQVNQTLRIHSLEKLKRNEYLLSVTHTARWRHPVRLSLKGISLRSIDGDVAVLEVKEVDGCDPGLYALKVDHSLGPFGRILALEKELMLVEIQGVLHYMKTLGAPDPAFRMIWRSHWSLTGGTTDSHISIIQSPQH